MIDLKEAKRVFKEYVSNYDIKDGKIALKIGHILRVSELSKRIALSMGLPDEDVKLAELIGLLHDIGRFEQVRLYNTFVDRDSINHGEYGVKILFEDGLIKKFDIDEKYYRVIRFAILNHNRDKIEERLTENELLHCKIIRDSDKLDIFHVLITDDIINTYGCESMENETFSDEIIREFKEERYINYKNRRTFGDIWISHIAYVFDFNFKGSYRVMMERDYINRLLDKMKFKVDKTKAEAEQIVKIANEYIIHNIEK